jgi:hypothetical protein
MANPRDVVKGNWEEGYLLGAEIYIITRSFIDDLVFSFSSNTPNYHPTLIDGFIR